MKDFSFHTMFISLMNSLRDFLKENNYCYELSGGISDFHFTITTDDEGAKKINDFLDMEAI